MSEKMTTTTFITLLTRDDHLMILEPAFLHDRVRRLQFNRVAHLTVWNETPVWRLVIALAVAALGLLLVVVGEVMGVLFVGGVLLGIGVWLAVRYLWFRRTVLRFVRERTEYRYHLIAPRRRVRDFVQRLTGSIVATQQRIAEELARSPADEAPELDAPPIDG